MVSKPRVFNFIDWNFDRLSDKWIVNFGISQSHRVDSLRAF